MKQLQITSQDLLEESRQRIEEVSAEQAQEEHGGDVVFLDVRDEIEVREDALIPGAIHVPRGLIEFKADPTSDYHENVFDPETRYICYCTVGLRSTFVTDRLDTMGYDIANLAGGIEAWREAGGNVEPYERSPTAE